MSVSLTELVARIPKREIPAGCEVLVDYANDSILVGNCEHSIRITRSMVDDGFWRTKVIEAIAEWKGAVMMSSPNFTLEEINEYSA